MYSNNSYYQNCRLSRRAYPGDYYLYLQDEVNWEAGQEIVLITTAMRDSREWHQNEIFVLSCVQTKDLPPAHPEVKSIVYLDSMVQHDHIARPEYQAEVGLLTRTIKIQGAGPDSEPMDVSPTHCQINKSPGQATFGYDSVPCPDTFLTGYGGHVIVHNNGKGFVEGVELYRMGQTNVLGRYPMHFHLLGGDCAGCYFKDSSIHHSFYRCLSIHGTSDIIASENVGYDIIGYCYYLEDGVEENNTLSYNLAAHVHFIGSPAIGVGQQTPHIPQSLDLTLPADITASGFYITNLHNNIVGNVAVGGWSGFAIPILKSPIGSHKDVDLDPSSRTTLLFDGNTAHSTGQFWGSAAAFYTGGVLYYEGDILTYNAGRPDQRHGRSPCVQDQETGACLHAWNRLTNTKVFLIPGAGIGSWTGRFDVIDYEAHDTGISLNVLEMGFGINNMVMGCRTGEILSLPVQRADLIPANGFAWYDTVQEHIMTNSTFRNCGFKSVEWDQYDASETRGCDSNIFNGCSTLSSVWGFVTHSNLHNPEIMQATRNITYDSVGRRFRYSSSVDSISGRTQNWMDVDGSVSGLNETTIIGSGLSSAGNWWNVGKKHFHFATLIVDVEASNFNPLTSVLSCSQLIEDDNVVPDVQAPLYFIQKNNGPARGLAHIHLSWDESLHSTVDITSCGNGGGILDCLAVGRIRHLGSKFNSLNDPQGGLPITANADMAGLVGGYGWLLKLNEGAPHTLNITQIEVMPETPLILSVAYPLGTNFTIKARAFYCVPSCNKACEESFSRVDTLEEVRKSEGNVYYFDEFTGLLSLRVIMFPAFFTGLPSWKLWDFTDIGHDGSGFALNRFERDGVLLPKMGWTQRIEIAADCTRSGAYCEGVVSPSDAFDNVCSSEDFVQHSYDRCCHVDNESNCEYAYSRSDAPTTAPTNSVSPTLYVGNIIENGDFEEGSTLCPWVKKGTSMAELHTVDAFQGSQAALISQRTQPWAGLLQDITEKFKFNVTYSFKAAAKILSDDGTYLKVAFRVTYDRPNDPSYLASVYYSSTFPSNAWTEFETTFIFANTELEPVVDIVLYFETPSGRTDDFLVDFVSMEALTEAIQ